MESGDSEEWSDAMHREMEEMKKFHTWIGFHM